MTREILLLSERPVSVKFSKLFVLIKSPSNYNFPFLMLNTSVLFVASFLKISPLFTYSVHVILRILLQKLTSVASSIPFFRDKIAWHSPPYSKIDTTQKHSILICVSNEFSSFLNIIVQFLEGLLYYFIVSSDFCVIFLDVCYITSQINCFIYLILPSSTCNSRLEHSPLPTTVQCFLTICGQYLILSFLYHLSKISRSFCFLYLPSTEGHLHVLCC